MRYLKKGTDEVYSNLAVRKEFRQLSPATILKKYIPEDCQEEINKNIDITALDEKIFNYFLKKEFIAIEETCSVKFGNLIKQTFDAYPRFLNTLATLLPCADCPYERNECDCTESCCKAHLEAWIDETKTED